jgi:hypothetical protein
MGKWISLSALQIVACLVGAAAGLIPVIEWTRPFWGLADYFQNGQTGRVYIQRVLPDTPAARAGFLDGDTVLMGAGRPLTFEGFNPLHQQIRPGEAVVFHVKRASGEIDLTARGEQPRLGALYYPTRWHPVLGGICLCLGLLTLALQRQISLWRPAVVIIVGLGLALGFYLTGEVGRQEFLTREGFDAANRMRWILYQLHFRGGDKVWEFHQSRVGLAASLTLALLASVELCWLIRSRRKTTQKRAK